MNNRITEIIYNTVNSNTSNNEGINKKDIDFKINYILNKRKV